MGYKTHRYIYCGVGDPLPKFSGVVKLDITLSEVDRQDCTVACRMFGWIVLVVNLSLWPGNLTTPMPTKTMGTLFLMCITRTPVSQVFWLWMPSHQCLTLSLSWSYLSECRIDFMVSLLGKVTLTSCKKWINQFHYKN